MTATDYLLSIGVSTGNSLDAADVVLTKFGADGSIADLDAISIPMPDQLARNLRLFRNAVVTCAGDMSTASGGYEKLAAEAGLNSHSADQLIAEYTLYVAGAVKQLTERFKKSEPHSNIDVVGFHGQTCAHQPPSIAKDTHETYTIQIGDGQLLADETGISVVYDFRSDDLMNGGEGAPLAPIHHEHLARYLQSRGKFSVAFCNAGNTGNISIISTRPEGSTIVFGWDTGPFNDYPDKLIQQERGLSCDLDGAVGSKGRVNIDLLRLLFDKGAITKDGTNYLLQPPPKSSDPQWYCLLPELLGEAFIGEKPLPFEDRLRTAEYFAAYVFFYSLKWIPTEIPMPTCFALCGGGWNNPVSRGHFEQLLRGDFDSCPVLPEHKELFGQITKRLQDSVNGVLEVALSDQFGFSGLYMEARLFADAAVCRIKSEPFSRPETTGCRTPTVLGIIRFPQRRRELASERLRLSMNEHSSAPLTMDDSTIFDGRWSRAARGWQTRINLVAKTSR
jgi:anhydro-N-acetylmuramic acid kinase